MRFTKGALTALTCALVLLPMGVANAGSGPAPKASPRVASESTARSEAGNPDSARAQAVGVCPDAHQIGSTGYVVLDGVQIASVKQFYSPRCQQNYGYLWIWQGFRDIAGDYDVIASIYSYSQDEMLGARSWTNTTAQEFWSTGTDTVAECTAAVGSVRKAGDPIMRQAASSKRC